jgi:hypothetical protein
MEQRLQAFESDQRVRQQAAAMQRVHEINRLADQTCRAMLIAALKAQLEEQIAESNRTASQHRCQ